MHAGRDCAICTDKRRKLIEKRVLEGASNASLSREFGISPYSLSRHARNHLRPAVKAAARQRREVAEQGEILERGDSIRDQLGTLVEAAHRMRREAERSGDARIALGSFRELTRMLELAAKLEGDAGSDAVPRNMILIVSQDEAYIAAARFRRWSPSGSIIELPSNRRGDERPSHTLADLPPLPDEPPAPWPDDCPVQR